VATDDIVDSLNGMLRAAEQLGAPQEEHERRGFEVRAAQEMNLGLDPFEEADRKRKEQEATREAREDKALTDAGWNFTEDNSAAPWE
jgi:hypothetical protein